MSTRNSSTQFDAETGNQHGIAYYAKPKAREAADGWIDRGDLTAILELFGIPREDWVID